MTAYTCCVRQATIDGRVVPTNHMDQGQLMQAIGGAQSISLTVLQMHRVSNNEHYHLPW